MPAMADNEFPGNKRARKNSTCSKNKKKAPSRRNQVETKPCAPLVSSPTSIAAFFNHVPPAKIACPLCGQMVSRYGINQHIDEACQKGRDDRILTGSAPDPVADSLVGNSSGSASPYFAEKAPTPEKKPNNGVLKAKTEAEGQTSPYFKANRSSGANNGEPQASMVRSTSRGRLSAKLFRRRLAQSDTESTQNAQLCPPQDGCGNAAEQNLDAAASEGGSQKENRVLVFESQQNPEVFSNAPETVGMSQECGRGALHGGFDASVPALSTVGHHPCSGLGIPAAEGRQVHPSGEALVADLCQFAGCSTTYNAEGLFFSDQQAPLLNVEEMRHDPVERVPSVGNDAKEIPLGGVGDLRNGVVDGASQRPLEDISFQNLDSSVLETVLSGGGPLSEAGDRPYYLQNFLMVLQAVLENEDDRRLFDKQDLETIVKFYQLSEAELKELSVVLDLLSAPELKTLAKAFHLPNPGAPKWQLLEGFLRLAKQRSIFSRDQDGVGSVILKRAKVLAGKSVRVCKDPRSVFCRVLLLFSLADPMEDEEAGSGGQTQLSTVLMVNLGRTVFPSYTVNRETAIFQDREDFIRYATAAHMLNDVSVLMANGNWREAHRLYKVAQESWQELKEHPSLRHHGALPEYLRCFTVGWVYTRILSRGVEILQRIQLYEEAVEQLEGLLSQEVYCTDSRGRWWDRLALNLHQHLKDAEKAASCIRKGLLDPFVRTGHRLALSQRAQRMKESPHCNKLRHLLHDLPLLSVEDVNHVTIKGRLCPQTGMGKSVFIMEDLSAGGEREDDEPSTVFCSVEELALAHYRKNGFDQGIHGEGSTFLTLFNLLMWDILFMGGIPDVFRNAYQAFPLDLYTDSFYENRREAIESRLQMLQEASPDMLRKWVEDIWNAQEGKAAALVKWDRFSSLQQAQSLVSCFGGPFLSGVCRRLSRDLRHSRGGLPDLVVWKSQGGQFKLVEVKGPSDRLSCKQMIWLAELQKLGAAVEVCHVAATGSKALGISK
uniref:Fanconi-associated nuclease n=1 Tax=Salvator merianae TaxID=96440 RepID=A0A8D0BL49_SALMN